MAVKTPAAKKRKIVQENRTQGRFQALHFAFWCGCGVCPFRSADGARWSAVLRWTEVMLCCCWSCRFLEEAYSPDQAFSWLHSALLIAVSSCSPGWSWPIQSPEPRSQMVIWMTCCCYLFHLLHQTFHLLVLRSSIKFHIDWFCIVNCVFCSNKCISGVRPPQLWLFFLLQKVGHPCRTFYYNFHHFWFSFLTVCAHTSAW